MAAAKVDWRALLLRARKVKNDEFYTLYEDVEKELNSYDISIWADKVVYCNCDTASSAFALFFKNNFERLKLKKLICTSFGGSVDLFNEANGKIFVFTKDGVESVKDLPENYDGSFDHPYSIQLLNNCDIVCTNPPFSRAIYYWKLLIRSKKKFVIISAVTIPVTPAFVPYFFDKKVWGGYNGIDVFVNPNNQLVRAAGHWYTNIPIENRPYHSKLHILPLKEIPAQYKRFDDRGMLIVEYGYFPNDYENEIAVSARAILNGILEKGFEMVTKKQYKPSLNGKICFGRVLIQKI